MNKELTGTATLLNKNDTSNMMVDPNDVEDNEEYDYFYQNNESMNMSNNEIAKITQAMGEQAEQGKPVFEKKQNATQEEYSKSAVYGLTKQAAGVMSGNQLLAASPDKNHIKITRSDNESMGMGISPI